MKKLSVTSKRIINFFVKNPDAKVKDVATKFDTHFTYVYKLRQRAREEVAGKAFVTRLKAAKLKPAPSTDERDLTITLLNPDGTEFSDSTIDGVLDSRAVDYGAFKDGAALMQGMKRLLADHAQKHGKTFADDQWEALEMIIHKVGRIVNGNPDKVDHWTDIAGYAKLVADRLEGKIR